MIDIVADLALLPLAFITWRHSKLVSQSIQVALAGAVLVRFGFEEFRAVSVLTGLAGAIEIERARSVNVRLKLGILLLGSMVVDGAALLAHRATGDWVQPAFQIGIVVVMGYVCVKGDPDEQNCHSNR
jgi:hypothetical protein